MKTDSRFCLGLWVVFLTVWGGSVTSAREIRGTVKDAGTGEAITGATVVVKSTATTLGTTTDEDGVFVLRNAPEGEFTLMISYVGYVATEVVAGKNPLEIGLYMDERSLDEVVVQGRIRSNTTTGMVATVRGLAQVASGISAAQIAQGPDRVASEVVRRVSGVTVIDERFVVVRGLSQRYNNAWINGLAAPSTETDSRAFPFDLVPSSQIDNLLVYKSPSPELPADFAGGFVKITSKGIPDNNSLEAGYTTGYNLTTAAHPFRSYKGWRIKEGMTLPDQRLSFSIARRHETSGGHTIGNVTAVNYGLTHNSLSGIQNRRYTPYSQVVDRPNIEIDYRDKQYSQVNRLGLLHNWSLLPAGKATRIEWKNLLNFTARDRLTERNGLYAAGSSPYYHEQTELVYTSRLTYAGQFSGEHLFGGYRSLEWNAGYSYASRYEPDRRIVRNQLSLGTVNDSPEGRPTEMEHITRYSQQLDDHTVSFSVNYKHTFRHTLRATLKTGLYGQYVDRRYLQRLFEWIDKSLTATERQLPFSQIVALGNDKILPEEKTLDSNSYNATIGHGAAYAAMEIPFGKLNLYGGFRLENHRTSLTRDAADAPNLTILHTRHVDNLHLLPSFNLHYTFNESHCLRAAYGHSVNRPELRELSESVYYDFDLFSEIIGNPDLRTAVVNQADLRYEYYPSAAEVITLGLFFKYFHNPIEWTFLDSGGGAYRYFYENARSARNFGAEVDIRKRLDFIGLPAFTLSLNAAWINSRVHFPYKELSPEPDRAMQGQSPYIINASLFYHSDRYLLDASLHYNRIGRRIVGLGKTISQAQDVSLPNSYELPRNVIDLTISKTIAPSIDLRLSVKDLLSEDILYKQFPHFHGEQRQQITRRYNPGQSISVGIACRY
ncbi:MAG: TonB-dependent receptor [Tannerellaceae bacterium]|jgi:outer membrane receptor protein involved in Fe transport|nr:TonB-dependent receptor [Tannerellaceae bacterium]